MRLRGNKLFLTGSLVALLGGIPLPAQEQNEPSHPLDDVLRLLQDRAVVLDIVARVIDQGEQEVWNETNSKVTIPGRPVGLKIVGTNIIVAVQFTPYLNREGGGILVAQGQIWIEIPNEGVHYETTMQAIPLAFGEAVYFFPLGSEKAENAGRIEIQLALSPYAQKD
jgi:hypothetical protein